MEENTFKNDDQVPTKNRVEQDDDDTKVKRKDLKVKNKKRKEQKNAKMCI